MVRSTTRQIIRISVLASAASSLLLAAGCTRSGGWAPVDMWNRTRLKPLAESPVFSSDSASLPLVPGTVDRGNLDADQAMYTGRSGGKLVEKFPFTVTPEVVERGQARFNIYCSPCHGRLGDGNGMIVKRGFPHPPDYAIVRLRKAPVGHFFDVMTHGYGVMYSYASRVPPSDRWAIATYIRALQSVRPIVKETPGEQFARFPGKSG